MTPEEVLKQIGAKGKFNVNKKLVFRAMEIYALQARIQERRDCIYLLESSLMDGPHWSKTYKQCMKDEIDNHNSFIQDLEKEFLTLTSPT